MSLSFVSSRQTARPLRQILQDEIIYWKERIESEGRVIQRTAWENIRRHQAQLIKLSSIHRREASAK